MHCDSDQVRQAMLDLDLTINFSLENGINGMCAIKTQTPHHNVYAFRSLKYSDVAQRMTSLVRQILAQLPCH